LGIGFVVAISPWTCQYSITRMDVHLEIFILFFFSWRADFFPFKYRHTRKRNTKEPSRKRNWNNFQMLGPQNLCKQIYVRSSRRGWES
jgi:hypothetical protein